MSETSATPAAQLTYEDIAGMIEHAVLRPESSSEEARIGCEIARQYRVAAVSIRPSDLDQAVRWMEGSGVAVASVVSYPHGYASTAAKVFETRDLLQRGATEIDTVINLGKMISRQFQYVEAELQEMAAICHSSGAILKVALETGYLSEDLKTMACKIAGRAGADYARTGTPFGPATFTIEDVRLMNGLCGERMKVKVSGGVRTLADVLAIRDAGAVRVGTIATVGILESWKAELAAR